MSKSISVGGVVINSQGQVLVVDQGENNWSLPKGHIEDGESMLDTAKREILEETGVSDLEYVMNLGNYHREALDNPEEVKNIFMFMFKTDDNDLHPQKGEAKEAKWVEREDVASLLSHPKDKDFFTKISPILEM